MAKRERRILAAYYCRAADRVILLVLRGPERVEGIDACKGAECREPLLPELGEVTEYLLVGDLPPPRHELPSGIVARLKPCSKPPTPFLHELLDSICFELSRLTVSLKSRETATT